MNFLVYYDLNSSSELIVQDDELIESIGDRSKSKLGANGMLMMY